MSRHPLVQQLYFTRSEFRRSIYNLSDADACKRFLPMNCISWNVGHLAWQEQKYFLFYGQGQILLPEINQLFSYGAPASTPPLAETLAAWDKITQAAGSWLECLTTEKLQEHVIVNGQQSAYLFGSGLQRVIYHYWYHVGENLAIRQMLGQVNLPEFVGNLDDEAPFRAGQ